MGLLSVVSQPVDRDVPETLTWVCITCAAPTDMSFATDASASESLFPGAYVILSLVVWPWSNGGRGIGALDWLVCFQKVNRFLSLRTS